MYRDMIKYFIPEKLLGHCSAQTIHERYPIVLEFESILTRIRPEFTTDIMRKCRTDVASDARQHVWKKDPEFVFNVAGRELKKKAKIIRI